MATARDRGKPAKKPYFRMALKNPYNLTLLLGGIGASLLTLNPIPALIALGGEAIWLLHAPDSKFLRKTVWDPQYEHEMKQQALRVRAAKLAYLPYDEQERVGRLLERHYEIDHLAEQNPSFTGDLLRSEIGKTQKLVDAFVEMAITVSRYDAYLNRVDLNVLERDREKWRARVKSEKFTEQERDIAAKNLTIIERRLEKLREVRQYLNVAKGQLDLIENSFQLIADQIVTMQSPAQLSGQLDELIDGVESIRQTAVDTERILNTLEA
ncbi:MAG TPA: hypothetical protein VMS98_00885 [Thermoanaerobaculia bacterium]|nr:hypothetical protein [Thermoanaerobaculia bacterium]